MYKQCKERSLSLCNIDLLENKKNESHANNIFGNLCAVTQNNENTHSHADTQYTAKINAIVIFWSPFKCSLAIC